MSKIVWMSGLVRSRMECELIKELRADYEQSRISCATTDEFANRPLGQSAARALRARNCKDFLVSSLTAEFSGCVLYAEIKKRIKNKAIFSELCSPT